MVVEPGLPLAFVWPLLFFYFKFLCVHLVAKCTDFPGPCQLGTRIRLLSPNSASFRYPRFCKEPEPHRNCGGCLPHSFYPMSFGV
ncbi:hypothetical protein B0H19DRAFT_1153269 [Mycena capillaripes]|nr:hypothetical protein B0H19DRAFT_1153269 [Mycena capillaripes]